jgi:hypothetical protein
VFEGPGDEVQLLRELRGHAVLEQRVGTEPGQAEPGQGAEATAFVRRLRTAAGLGLEPCCQGTPHAGHEEADGRLGDDLRIDDDGRGIRVLVVDRLELAVLRIDDGTAAAGASVEAMVETTMTWIPARSAAILAVSMVLPPPMPISTSVCFSRIIRSNRESSCSEHSPWNSSIGRGGMSAGAAWFSSKRMCGVGEARIRSRLPNRAIWDGSSARAPGALDVLPGE